MPCYDYGQNVQRRVFAHHNAEMQYLIKKPGPKVREQKKRGVEFPWYKKVKTAKGRNPAMICHNHTARYLPCQNGTATDPQTRWRCKGIGALSLNKCRQPTEESPPPLPGKPPAPPGNISGPQCSQIINLPARYAYSHTSLPCAESFTLDASAQDIKKDTNFDPDKQTDEGIATG